MLHENSAGQPCALITHIQKYTIHDGPGIRTAIFFKGCTMHCLWCSNPETILPKREIGFYPDKCLTLEKCGLCQKICPHGVHGPLEFENGRLKAVTMGNHCDTCLLCVNACPGRAIMLWGKKMKVAELLKVIIEDRSFYQKTGGGVTLSGGEVLLQWEFVAMLLEACKKQSIHTCVETALHCPTEHLQAVLEYTDLVIADIKHMDTEKHRIYTGAGNELILKNIEDIVKLGKRLVLRTPIVPGYNSDRENIRKVGAFIRDVLKNNIVTYQLLPYRRLGTEKYDSLGMSYALEDYTPPKRIVWERELLELVELLVEEFGIPAVAGSSNSLGL